MLRAILLLAICKAVAHARRNPATHNIEGLLHESSLNSSGPEPPAHNETTAKFNPKYIEKLAFKQRLDHFNDSSSATFTQRYFQYRRCFSNDSSLNDGGPVGLMFVIVNGESGALKDQLVVENLFNHTIPHIAMYFACKREFHALVVLLEHRYYGKSQVVDVKTASVNPETARFLRVEQAVEDVATFIRAKAAEFNIPYSKVIVTGCSYAGTVATYFRMIHPELSAGVISFSGPLQPTFDFSGYTTTVRKTFKWRYPDCYTKIDNLFKSGKIAKLAATAKTFGDIEDEGFVQLLNGSNSHKPITDGDSVRQLYAGFAADFINMLGEMQQNDPFGIMSDACVEMRDSDIASLATMLKVYDAAAKRLPGHTTSWSKKIFEDADQYFWTYQTCTQFGFFQLTSAAQRDWFPKLASGDDVITQDAPSGDATPCTRLFKIAMKDVKNAVAASNRSLMASNRVANLSNYFIVNGQWDPWAQLAKLPVMDKGEATKRNIKTVVISGAQGYHCPFLSVGKRYASGIAKPFLDNVEEQIVLWTTPKKG